MKKKESLKIKKERFSRETVFRPFVSWENTDATLTALRFGAFGVGKTM